MQNWMQIGLDLGLTAQASTDAKQSRGPQKKEIKDVGYLRVRPLQMSIAQILMQDDASPCLYIYIGVIQPAGFPYIF